MKVSLSWLQEYVSTGLAPHELADRLTMAGLEVEEIEELYTALDHVVVARVEQTSKHPNADRLSCCKVLVKEGEEPVPIVCGAPNVRAGMMVACALPGAVLPGDFPIKKSKIRGEVSQGMLCSAKELHLGGDTGGILDLDTDAQPGTPLRQALGLDDVCFDIGLTPNRPDCLGIIGIAREVAAFRDCRSSLTLPHADVPENVLSQESILDHISIRVEDPDLCPRYMAGMLFDVKVGPSPLWLQQRLSSVGLTPVNNVVDVTNFVMMETGQPLHAFDYQKLKGSQIVVKKAGKKISFTTLDAKEHRLEPDALMICDGERPVAIAGVMGGKNSEITEETTQVLIESAYFHPVSVRKTAKKTGIPSDASHRFERGVDEQGTKFALKRALSVLAEISQATVAKGIVDEYGKQGEPVTIDLNPDALNARLGTLLDKDIITELLESVEFQVQPSSSGLLKVCVPSFRVDVSRPEDLSEEVARLWGYDSIETTDPVMTAKGQPLSEPMLLQRKIRRILSGTSFFEAINYNFVPQSCCDDLGLSESDPCRSTVKILNPLSEQLAVLRTSLLSGLLENLKHNNARQTKNVRIFEMGKVFFDQGDGVQPIEQDMISGIMSGNREDQSWFSREISLDFFDLKGVVESLFTELGIHDVTFSKIQDDSLPYYEKGYGAYVQKDSVVLGSLGKISQAVLKRFGIRQDAYVFDLNFTSLARVLPGIVAAQPLFRFPCLERDLTLIVDANVPVGTMLSELKALAVQEATVEKIFLFDLFEGEPIAQGKKSLSFRVVYRDAEKTLTEKKVKKLHANISQKILNMFDAQLP